MKRLIVSIALAVMVCTGASAQSFLEGLGKSAVERAKQGVKNKIEQKVDEKVDQGVESVLSKGKKNKAEEAAPVAPEAQQAAPVQAEGAAGAWTCPDCGKAGNTGDFCSDCGAKRPGAASAEAAPATAKKSASVDYAKSDFVPGDEIFFEDLLDNEKVGEFPSMWDFLSGEECEVAVVNGKKAIKLGESCEITPLMKDADYLPEEFTLEYDVYVIDSEEGGANSYLGPEFRDADGWVMGTHFAPMKHNWGWYGSYKAMNDDDRNFNTPEEKIQPLMKLEDWNHVAISFNKRAMKIYLNGTRIANIPNMKRPTRFKIYSLIAMDEKNPNYFFTNIRLAKGAVPLYDRLTTDGKIVTYAITFETGKADLKPESMVEIARIAKLMTENPNISFEVQGHCDATGSDKVNDPLSQKRAEAIVAALVEQGIAGARLSAVGKGSHSPLADNSTEEGRAKNRRVEFVKK